MAQSQIVGGNYNNQFGNFGNLGGGSPMNLKDLLSQIQAQRDEANKANEGRFQNILGLLKNQGISSKEDVRRGGIEERGNIQQQLISQGLGGSTALQALQGRSRERQQRESTRIDESVANRIAGVTERRTDRGPDVGAFAQLLQSFGQGVGNQGGLNPDNTTFAGGAGSGRGGGGGGGGGGSSGGSGNQSRRAGGGGGGSSGGRVGTFRNSGPYTKGFKVQPQGSGGQASTENAKGPLRAGFEWRWNYLTNKFQEVKIGTPYL